MKWVYMSKQLMAASAFLLLSSSSHHLRYHCVQSAEGWRLGSSASPLAASWVYHSLQASCCWRLLADGRERECGGGGGC